MWELYLIPLYILGVLIVLLGTFALLSRIKGGKYLRPVVNVIAKVPLFRRGLEKASRAAMERQNPELASAMRKLERTGATRDPAKAEQALSRLSSSERQAYLDAAGDYGAMPEATNRAQRRRLEKMQQKGKRRG